MEKPDFKKAQADLGRLEGGYSQNPNDPGSETLFGISRHFHPAWPGWQMVDQFKKQPNFPKNAEKEEVLQRLADKFYEQFYWSRLGLDQLLSHAIARELYEQSINRGDCPAIGDFQRILNTLNYSHRPEKKYFEDLAADGRPGPKTIAAANIVLSKPNGESVLLKYLDSLQGAHFISVIEKNPRLKEFAWGWALRLR
jgi:lysozyme family protein